MIFSLLIIPLVLLEISFEEENALANSWFILGISIFVSVLLTDVGWNNSCNGSRIAGVGWDDGSSRKFFELPVIFFSIDMYT